MKKSNVHNFLFAVSVFLILGFVLRFGIDIVKYDSQNNSAPLYVYALVRVTEFILPSIILFIAAMICKRKFANKEDKEEFFDCNEKISDK